MKLHGVKAGRITYNGIEYVQTDEQATEKPVRAIMRPGTKRTELLDKLIKTMSERGKEARGEKSHDQD